MKDILLASTLFCITIISNAQSMGENYLRSAKPKNVEGNKYLNIQTIIPISISSVMMPIIASMTITVAVVRPN